MENCILMRLIQRRDWGNYQPLVDRLEQWTLYPLFLDILGKLNYDVLFESPIHGVGHIERTLLHGAFCAMSEPLDEEDTKILLLACCYHDVGRVNDSVDDLHGYRSSLRLGELTGMTGEALKMMQSAVDAHSRNDRVLEETVQSYDPADYDRSLTIAQLLKDADGLDRVRIWDLDPRFLRRKASRDRAPFAKELYLRYQRELNAEAVPDFVRSWKHIDGNGNPV